MYRSLRKEALNREFARGTAISVELAIKDPKRLG
jgi:hypothetical protein